MKISTWSRTSHLKEFNSFEVRQEVIQREVWSKPSKVSRREKIQIQKQQFSY